MSEFAVVVHVLQSERDAVQIEHQFDGTGNHRLVERGPDEGDERSCEWTTYRGIARLETPRGMFLGFTDFFGEEVLRAERLGAKR
jgi:hypothetical protein